MTFGEGEWGQWRYEMKMVPRGSDQALRQYIESISAPKNKDRLSVTQDEGHVLVWTVTGACVGHDCMVCAEAPKQGDLVLVMGDDLVHFLCVVDELMEAKAAVERAQVPTADALLALVHDLEAKA